MDTYQKVCSSGFRDNENTVVDTVTKQIQEAQEAQRLLEQRRQYARAAWLKSGVGDRRRSKR